MRSYTPPKLYAGSQCYQIKSVYDTINITKWTLELCWSCNKNLKQTSVRGDVRRALFD